MKNGLPRTKYNGNAMRELKKRIGLVKVVKSGAGFTILEMLIVLFITVTIGMVSITNFRAAEKQKRVSLASETVINVLRTAQIYALAGKNTSNSNPACRVPQNYYLSFTGGTGFSLYATNNNPAVCGSAPDLIETYALPSNTDFKEFKLNGSVVSSLSVFFSTPFAQSTASSGGSAASYATAEITVKSSSQSSITRTVVVDGVSGKIGE